MNLSEAISAAWDGAQSNVEALENLLAIMRAEPEVYTAAMEPHERAVAQALVAGFKRERRAYIWSRPSAPDDRVKALTRANAVSLYDMRLPSGKRLGDAVRADLVEAAAFYADLAKRNDDKAKFLAAVAQKMKGARPVSAVWTAAELEDIRNA